MHLGPVAKFDISEIQGFHKLDDQVLRKHQKRVFEGTFPVRN